MLAAAVATMIASGIAPHDPVDWWLENVVPVIVILGLTAGLRHRRLSWQAYLAILLLLAIHELGAHFTYAKVPYEQWTRALTDHSLNAALGWKRNQYDRLVHFSYGLLVVIPLREMLCRQTPLRGGWLAFLALSLVLASSALYELVEWIGGEYLGDDQAEDFVATQKDIWDAQKDMALAFLGALICLALRAILRFGR
ncbi:Inner membrane protein YjdF [compost metagenome]